MQIYLSIDDTDNLESPGTGQLAEILSKELEQSGLASNCSNISRHQLFVNSSIAYTSHNSAMCFSAEVPAGRLDQLIEYAQRFLVLSAAPGSDPGLCVVPAQETLNKEPLIEFGEKAKLQILTKDEAYFLAAQTGVHLSEHGGTGEGVVGALAGSGLRLQGDDGRFRGWYDFGSVGTKITSKELCSHPAVDAVVNEQGYAIAPNSRVTISDDRIKTVHRNHLQVLVVKTDSPGNDIWTTLDRREVKQY